MDKLNFMSSNELIEVTDFLNQLQQSGLINMFGAAVVIRQHFSCTKHQSHLLLQHWMENYSDD